MTRKLTRKQEDALLLVAAMLPRPRMKVRPAYDGEAYARAKKRTGISMRTTDLHIRLKPLAKAGLVHISGVAYGPKTYQMTTAGRALAIELLKARGIAETETISVPAAHVRAGDVLVGIDRNPVKATPITKVIGLREDGTLHVHVEDALSDAAGVTPDRYLRGTSYKVERAY